MLYSEYEVINEKLEATAKKLGNVSFSLTDPDFDLVIEKDISEIENNRFDTAPFWVFEDLAKHCGIDIGDIFSVSFLTKKEGEPRYFEAELSLFLHRQLFKLVFYYESKNTIIVSEIRAVDPACQLGGDMI